MRIIQKLKTTLIGTLLVIGLLVVVAPTLTYAATKNGCETETAVIMCTNVDTTKPGVQNTGLWSLLLTAINILSAGVGIAAIGGIVYGAIIYTSAGGSPEQVKKAIGIITNVVIGVIAYALMFSLLNFIIPGGLFTNAIH
jgi:hypothetical protein